jgi:ankyrin repeat protein
MDCFKRIAASYNLFVKLNCCSEDNLNGHFGGDASLAFLDLDKMRLHIMNCLAALRVAEIKSEKELKAADNVDEKQKLMKRKVFRAACLMMIDTNFDNDEVVVSTILSAFPYSELVPMSDERSWLPMHFAIALNIQNKIGAEDVHMLHTTDPLAMYRLSQEKLSDEEGTLLGCTPAHLLCMQKVPDMSMVRYFCIRDPKAFLLCDRSGRCALHLATQYSESVELLQMILQIDETMVNSSVQNNDENETKPLGFLCRRPEFPTFHEMVACLVEINSSVQVIYDGVMGCLESYETLEPECQRLYPGSRGENTLILLGILLKANSEVTNYRHPNSSTPPVFHTACSFLRGEFGVAVLSLFLIKDSSGLRSADSYGYLPIHWAAMYSSIDVLKLLHKVYPESLSMVTTTDANTMLHLAFLNSDDMEIIQTIQYLCDQCPAFIHQKNNEGRTPLHDSLTDSSSSHTSKWKIKLWIYLCNTNAAVLTDKCTPSDTSNAQFGQIPLHLLIRNHPPRSNISDEADCLRLFLRLYPTSAGIKDGHLLSPYDMAVSRNLSTYFIRLLLSNDPTIDPVRRHNLNFAARRDGMFLAFRALSANIEPTIWAKIRFTDKNLLDRVISYL